MGEEQTVQQMRDTIERLSKDEKATSAENKQLRTDLRVRDAREAFSGEGYNPKHGDLYAASNPEGEFTVEAIDAFAKEMGLAPLEIASKDEGEGTSKETDGTENLAAASGGGSRSGDGGAGGSTSEQMTRKDWQQLYLTDPVAAKEAVASGRVQISGDNPHLSRPQTVPSGGNPYLVRD